MNPSTPLVHNKTTTSSVGKGDSTRRVERQLSPQGGLRLKSWPVLLIAVLSLLVLGAIYYRFTYVSGIELNSHTWERRAFAFRRDPLSGVQLTDVQHNVPQRTGLWSSIANPHAQILAYDIAKHLPQKSTQPLRWDLVRIEGSGRPGAAASILTELLDARDRSLNMYWINWSQQNPARAAVVWPAAAQLVEFGQYSQLPSLCALAVLENSPEELSSSVRQLVQQAMLESDLDSSAIETPAEK